MATDDTPPVTVQEGLYFGFSKAELDVELERYKAAVKKQGQMRQSAGGGLPQFVAVNGRQVTYTFPEGVASFDHWRQELQNAFAQLSGDCQPFSDRSVARFR